jgi:hypothetical protein
MVSEEKDIGMVSSWFCSSYPFELVVRARRMLFHPSLEVDNGCLSWMVVGTPGRDQTSRGLLVV